MHAATLNPGPRREKKSLPFRERAAFVAGTARSGTTLLTALFDGHPEMLALPEETAYFPTVLHKYAARGRAAQVDYLVQQSLSNVLFGGRCKWGLRDYSHFPTAEFRRAFEERALAPRNEQNDLLVLMVEVLASVQGRPLGTVRRWLEKTPANRNHLRAIFHRFPQARVFLTIRDPRALLASQIQLESRRRLRRFCIHLVVQHWQTVARLILQQRANPDASRSRILVVTYRELIEEPERTMRAASKFLEIGFDPILFAPTKFGRSWSGNSAAAGSLAGLSHEPVNRWRTLLSETEVGWIEWHCRDLMEQLGYEPIYSRRRLRHWFQPVRGETPREYLKSRLYSLRGREEKGAGNAPLTARG